MDIGMVITFRVVHIDGRVGAAGTLIQSLDNKMHL